MNASIHPAHPGSIPDLQRLQYKCFGEDRVWCPCIWEQAIDRAQVLVAVAGENEVIGFGVRDGKRVCGVGVWSPFHGHGIGTALLLHLEGSVTRVLESDLRSQLWLKSCGWVCDKIFKVDGTKYYQFVLPIKEELPCKPRRKRATKKTSAK